MMRSGLTKREEERSPQREGDMISHETNKERMISYPGREER